MFNCRFFQGCIGNGKLAKRKGVQNGCNKRTFNLTEKKLLKGNIHLIAE